MRTNRAVHQAEVIVESNHTDGVTTEALSRRSCAVPILVYWLPRGSLSRSPVLIDQSRDCLGPSNRHPHIDHSTGLVQWRQLISGLMRPMIVVVPLEFGKYPAQMPLTMDQHVVQALTP